MSIDVTRKMNAKDRRIWRRRDLLRHGHTIRCYQKEGRSCTCNARALRDWGIRERADKVHA
jgi:hypothetical protein